MAGKKRGRPKSKKRMYFDEVVQDAIIQYNLSEFIIFCDINS